MKAILALLLAVFFATPASAATYYVATNGNDSWNGTSPTFVSGTTGPWLTLGKAASTLVAGDTVIIRDGTYVSGTVQPANGGTSGAPITFQAENPLQAILSSTSSCAAAFSTITSYITVKGLRIKRDPSNVACPSGYTSANCGIRAYNTLNPVLGGNQSTGAVGFVADGVQVDDTPQFDIGIKTNQDDTIVQNSILYEDLEAFNAKNVIFRNNTINLLHINSVYDPAINLKGGARNAQVYKNTVNVYPDSTGWEVAIDLGSGSGCCWYDSSTHYEGYNLVAYDNIVVDQTSSGHGTSLDFRGCVDCWFIHNVAMNWVQVGLQNGSENGFPPNPLPSNPHWIDNIFLGNNHIAQGDFGSLSGGFSGTLFVDYNDWYNYSSGVPSQTHAVTGNPLFVNPPSDFHLQTASPAIDTGTLQLTIPAYGGGTIDISLDYAGVARVAPADLGIYNVIKASPAPCGPAR
jgi:hypothetical protein